MTPLLSVVVLTHNDELSIVDCMEALLFANEIIVIDDESSDRTIEICRNYTKNIFQKKLNGNYANQRNYALNMVKSNWVLYIDSDEYVSQALQDEIKDAITNKNFSGYFVNRTDFIWGQEIRHGEAGQTKLLRLAQKGSGKWHGKVHEKWKVDGEISELESPLKHVPHKSVFEFIREVDAYSTLRSEELFEKGVKSSAATIVFYPLAKFVRNYFFKMGYKDGIPGFIYAVIMSFHSFLVRGKLYLLQNKSID